MLAIIKGIHESNAYKRLDMGDIVVTMLRYIGQLNRVGVPFI